MFAGLHISPAHREIRGVSDKDKHRYMLGAASESGSFRIHINFISLKSSGEEFLTFKVPQIFTDLSPLREKQKTDIFTFFLIL